MKTFEHSMPMGAGIENNSPSKVSKVARVTEFDYLRGIAIILIVLGHSITNSNHGFPVWLENILRGGTGVFVFISGFFFHHVFSQSFNFQKFMGKKCRNVLVPFLVVSAFAIVVNFFGFMWIDGASFSKALALCGQVLERGYVLFPHWYIPFIMATFLCSGLHFRYLKLSLFSQLSILIAFSLVALVIQRPEANENVLQSVIYFTPFYLIGMLYSQYLEWMKQNYRYFLIAALVTVLLSIWLQSSVFFHVGDYHKNAFQWKGIDLQFIQKVGLCILLVGFCRHWVSERLGKHLTMIAGISFAIFFLHPLLGMMWGNTKYFLLHFGYIQPNTTLWYSLVSSVVLFAFQFYGTVWLVRHLKRLFGSKSRLLIGA
ncbi:acyltransferase family protein [Marinomonas spartinae]|uniref:acyltransferase family protein n=1 Tax=Marinomonas spartinae TaxID=1792290 RepID=UPI000A6F2DA4|nr:acyltransferase [Marinomonas spartinae]